MEMSQFQRCRLSAGVRPVRIVNIAEQQEKHAEWLQVTHRTWLEVQDRKHGRNRTAACAALTVRPGVPNKSWSPCNHSANFAFAKKSLRSNEDSLQFSSVHQSVLIAKTATFSQPVRSRETNSRFWLPCTRLMMSVFLSLSLVMQF